MCIACHRAWVTQDHRSNDLVLTSFHWSQISNRSLCAHGRSVTAVIIDPGEEVDGPQDVLQQYYYIQSILVIASIVNWQKYFLRKLILKLGTDDVILSVSLCLFFINLQFGLLPILLLSIDLYQLTRNLKEVPYTICLASKSLCSEVHWGKWTTLE